MNCCSPGGACTGRCTSMQKTCPMHGSYWGNISCPSCSSSAALPGSTIPGTFPLAWSGHCSEHGYWYGGGSCPGCEQKLSFPVLGAEPAMVFSYPVVPEGFRLVSEEKLRRLGELVDEVVELAVELLPEEG